MLNKYKKRKERTKKSGGCGCLAFFGLILLMLFGLYLLFNVVDFVEGLTDSWETEEVQQTSTTNDHLESIAPQEKKKETTVDSIKEEKKSEESCQEIILGNRSSSGVKIYHVPGGDFYDETVAEEKFCTQAEAIEAGYRKSKR